MTEWLLNGVVLLTLSKPDSYTPEQRREYMRNYYLRRLQEAKDLLGGRCVGCGSELDLQFDHIDPKTKSHNITNMLMWAKSLWIIELKKCQLLCLSCHKKKTSGDIASGVIVVGTPRRSIVHGTIWAYSGRGCRCSECSEAKRLNSLKYR